MNRLVMIIIFLFINSSLLQAQDLVPFVIPVDQNPESQISYKYKPLSENDRLTTKGEKFVTSSGEEVRIWGVNLSFGANFPTHKDAERIAHRMAAAGVNSVRFHHMDSASWPRGIWDETGKRLHPEALDRLDFFIDQLAKCGIYSNINLHVGKEHSRDIGLPGYTNNSLHYDKMISIFTPEIIEAHREYAQKLLTHINKYRKVRYLDDYAVGFVEITNENSLFMWSAAATLPNLPDYYANILQSKYNKWLSEKYGNNDKLRSAWLAGSEPYGTNKLTNASLAMDENGTIKDWNIEQHGPANVKAKNTNWQEKECLEIEPGTIDEIEWHLQINYRNLDIKEWQNYTVRFYAAAQEERELSLYVNENHADWKNLGLVKNIKLDNKWKRYEINFVASKSDSNARLGFSFGKDAKKFFLADIEMMTGVEYTISDKENLDNLSIKLYGQLESLQRKADRMTFLAETEKAYFDGMYSYIKNDLGCKANITGTIVFGPLGLWAQSGMDYIDSHAYWQHPSFPGKPWDSGNWIVKQAALSANPAGSTLLELSSERLADKPYTVSEYNHPAPLDSQSECVPMAASWAARQNWNGIWFYTYSHSNMEWDRDKMNSFFDIDTNPGKWGFMRAGAAIYRDRTVSIDDSQRKFRLDQMGEPILAKLAEAHIKYGSNMKAIFDEGAQNLLDANDTWQNNIYIVKAENSVTICGEMKQISSELASERISIDIDKPENASIIITDIEAENAFLISACGRCENSNMKFSESRDTVGNNWGHGPVQIETVSGRIDLKNANLTGWKFYALKPDGSIAKELEIKDNQIKLAPEYQTMWYLLKKE